MKTGTLAVTSIQIRANSFDLLSRLAEDLAHEIKNPVHAAVINTELIRRRIAAQSEAEALDRVRVLEVEIGRAHELIDWLLRLLRPSRESVSELVIDQVVSEILPLIELLGRLSKVDVRFDPVGMEASAFVSVSAFRHALLNLVVNAIDAMRPEGGRLLIEGACDAEGVRVRLTDTGPGIPTDAIDRIGTPGFSTRPGHAGLGLSVAHALLEKGGGRIEFVDAGDGSGASFTLWLPRATGA